MGEGLFDIPPVKRQGGRVLVLDQRRLPEEVWIEAGTFEECCLLIKEMAVRGAGAIGIMAAYSSALAFEEGLEPEDFVSELLSTRPTAVELRRGVEWVVGGDGDKWELAEDYRKRVEEETFRAAERAARFIDDGDVLMTHCHTGSVAVGGPGTALGAIKLAWADGKRVFVWVKETRPRGKER